MTDFVGIFSDNIKRVSQAFLTAFYLPGALFVALHLFVLFPAWQNPSLPLSAINPVSTVQGLDLSQLLLGLALPALVGLVLLGLNQGIIVLYEGRPQLLKRTIFWPLHALQLRRHKKHYDELFKLRAEYRRKAVELATQDLPAERAAVLRQLLTGLQHQIHTAEDRLEQQNTLPRLPLDRERVNPTAFGNTYALAEEYPFERYGIDSVLFWPRLRDLIDTHAQPLSERLSQQKTRLDMVLNLSFLSGITALECGLVLLRYAFFAPAPINTTLWLVVGISALTLMMSFYAESVRAVQTQGELIKICFDFHRRLILDAFRLKSPTDLLQEQILWVRLAAFIRRGHLFYFPAEMVEPPVLPATQRSP